MNKNLLSENKKSIKISSLKSLNSLPDDYDGEIYLSFKKLKNRIDINKSYKSPLIIRSGEFNINAKNILIVRNSSKVFINTNDCTICIYNKSKASSILNKSVFYAYDESEIIAGKSSTAIINDDSYAEIYDETTIIGNDFSNIFSYGKNNITINNHSRCVAYNTCDKNSKCSVFIYGDNYLNLTGGFNVASFGKPIIKINGDANINLYESPKSLSYDGDIKITYNY